MRHVPVAWRGPARWLPALLWMTVIFLLSSQGDLAVSKDAAVDRPFRVVAHLATYGLLAALILVAICGRHAPSARALLAALGLAALYALGDELHQAFVPGRTGRLDDVVTDVVGATAGVVLAAIVLATWAGTDSGDELERGSLDTERQHP